MSVIDIALLIPRIVIGLIFIGHGSQKLFGWFGGGGLSGTSAMFEKTGLHPSREMAILAGLLEFLGGLGLVLGLATPLAALAITAAMLNAIAFVHWSKGLWNTGGGYEYPIVNLSVMVLYGLAGPGGYSLDAYLALGWPTPILYIAGTLLALVATAVLRAMAAHTLAKHGQTGAHA